jgi:hypothetical protein
MVRVRMEMPTNVHNATIFLYVKALVFYNENGCRTMLQKSLLLLVFY